MVVLSTVLDSFFDKLFRNFFTVLFFWRICAGCCKKKNLKAVADENKYSENQDLETELNNKIYMRQTSSESIKHIELDDIELDEDVFAITNTKKDEVEYTRK